MKRRGPYKLYNKNPSLHLPKVSKWRRNRDLEENIISLHGNSSILEDDTMNMFSLQTSDDEYDESPIPKHRRKEKNLPPGSSPSDSTPPDAPPPDSPNPNSFSDSDLPPPGSPNSNSFSDSDSPPPGSPNSNSFSDSDLPPPGSPNSNSFSDSDLPPPDSPNSNSFSDSDLPPPDSPNSNSFLDPDSPPPGSPNSNSFSDSDLPPPDSPNSNSFSDSDLPPPDSPSVSERFFQSCLYSDASISTQESWDAIMEFSIKNTLSYTAIQNLLDLLKLHCPSPNNLPPSIYKLKKHYEEEYVYFNRKQICSNCFLEVAIKEECSRRRCYKKKAELCQFYILKFEDSLKRLCEEHWEKLLYPFQRKSERNIISDIQDGEVIKNLMKPGGFLAVPNHIGLIINTDGVQTFNASKHSIWPIFLMVSNLPPKVRILEKYLILAGIWFGPTKPKEMSTIIRPIVIKLKELQEHGIEIETSGRKRLIHPVLLAGIFDLPAKAAVLNSVQFNGFYGCNYCKDKGEHVSNTHTYPPDDTHSMRTPKEVKESALEAERTGKPVMGVKGLSVLSGVINIPFSVPIDYMHSVLEGVTKTLLKTWFNSKNHNREFYLRPYMSRIDKKMSRIKPPHEFRRTPRSIEASLLFWKANEYKAFLLVYAIPVLKDYLPAKYLVHLSLLVYAIHILLSDSIEIQVLKELQQYLQYFYQLIPDLYVHFVKLWGPLWTQSTFCFENANGVMKRQIHGTRNILLQTVFMMRMRQIFSPDALKKDSIDGHTITDNTFVIGKIVKKDIPPSYANVLGTSCPLSFGRLKLNGVVYHSNEQQKHTGKRSSSTISFLFNSTHSLGDIQLFSLSPSPSALVKMFTQTDESILEDDIDIEELPEEMKHLTSLLDGIYYKVRTISDDLVMIPLSAIISKCILIPIKHSEFTYIVKQPNHIECH